MNHSIVHLINIFLYITFPVTQTCDSAHTYSILYESYINIFIVISLAAVAGIVFYLVKYRPKNPWLYIPVSMIAGGGVGNLIDRLFYGESFGNGLVVDFLDFCAFPDLWHWIFNVADAFVVVGAGIVFVYLIGEIIKEGKEEKRKKAQPQTEAPKDDHEG